MNQTTIETNRVSYDPESVTARFDTRGAYAFLRNLIGSNLGFPEEKRRELIYRTRDAINVSELDIREVVDLYRAIKGSAYADNGLSGLKANLEKAILHAVFEA